MIVFIITLRKLTQTSILLPIHQSIIYATIIVYDHIDRVWGRIMSYVEFQNKQIQQLNAIEEKIKNLAVMKKIEQLPPKTKEGYAKLISGKIEAIEQIGTQLKENQLNTKKTQPNLFESMNIIKTKMSQLMDIINQLTDIQNSITKLLGSPINPAKQVQMPYNLPAVPMTAVTLNSGAKTNSPSVLPQSQAPLLDKPKIRYEDLENEFASLDSPATSLATTPRSIMTDEETALSDEFDGIDSPATSPATIFPSVPTKPVLLGAGAKLGTSGSLSPNQAPPLSNTFQRYQKEMKELRKADQLIENKAPAVAALYTKEANKFNNVLEKLEKSSDSVTKFVNHFAPVVHSDEADKLVNETLANFMPKR